METFHERLLFFLVGLCVHNVVNAEVLCSKPSELTGVPNTMVSHQGFGQSNYGNNMNCQWHIHDSNKQLITLWFNSFDVEEDTSCSYDSVTVSDASFMNNTLVKGKTIGIYCGKDLPPYISSSGSDLIVTFQTDSDTTREGFNFSYAFVDTSNQQCPHNSVACGDGRCIPTAWICDGDHDCSTGIDENNCTNLCPTGESPCHDGKCINTAWLCDGDDDCDDHSDEKNCTYHEICAGKEFQCDNGRCIDGEWICDGDDDCHDGSDEKNCTVAPGKCGDTKYQCDDGRCIPDDYLCDGDFDCPDDSDEHNCTAARCNAHKWHCPTGKCIDETWLCDGDNDCGDNSDEKNCSSIQHACSSFEFTCGDGKCIASSWKCDGDDDCDDHTDEQNCTYHEICANREFQCSNGKCIDSTWICDGDNDCHDMSDEKNCTVEPGKCGPMKYQCDDGRCIPDDYLCDGDYDCPDDSDEHNCTAARCNAHKYHCANGKCIDETWLCDGDNDCGDGSDEANCTVQCTARQFTCANGRCVNAGYVCDGDNDCRDFSDEKNCTSVCRQNQFKCTNGKCISRGWVCDHDNDCGDLSDETNCTTLPGNLPHTCGSWTQLNASTGHINSANYPNHYFSDTDCTWQIKVPKGQSITLSFFAPFGMEDSGKDQCDYDSVAIYDTHHMHLEGTFCGQIPPSPLVIKSDAVTIAFRTDDSNNDVGFKLEWKANDGNRKNNVIGQQQPIKRHNGYSCGGPYHFKNQNGTISMKNSKADSRCLWHIEAPTDFIIHLHFQVFHLESSLGCQHGHLSVFDGLSTLSTKLVEFCGSELPIDVDSSSNSLVLLYESDKLATNGSFLVDYTSEINKAINASLAPACMAGGISLTLPKGEIQSPGYDGITSYGRNLNCTWKISAPPGEVITFIFNSFDTEREAKCSYDYLDIREGSASIKKLCGTKLPREITSSGENLTLVFHSDGDVGGLGFNITYYSHVALPLCTSSEFTCKNGSCIDYTLVCDKSNDCVDLSDEMACVNHSNGCGSPSIQPIFAGDRIVGGREAIPGSWPWMVSLVHEARHTCGGTIILKDWIITAAHCFDNDEHPKNWIAMAGKHHAAKPDPMEKRLPISKIIVHEEYNSYTTDNDIALVKLSHSMNFSHHISPVCLPSHDYLPGTFCYATGWGSTQGTCCPGVLKQVGLPMMATSLCNSSLYYSGDITESMFCAGYPEGGKDACHGDSGGPLVCKDKGNWQIEGISSWGIGCAAPRNPGVYTRVFKFIRWIQQTIASN